METQDQKRSFATKGRERQREKRKGGPMSVIVRTEQKKGLEIQRYWEGSRGRKSADKEDIGRA